MQKGLKKGAHAFLKAVSSTDPAIGYLPEDLVLAIRDVYEPAGMKVTSAAKREVESAEYGACRLSLDDHTIAFRVAKTTPTKIGQFVTIWKRPGSEITPLDISDGVDFVVVNVSDATHRGQFILDQELLVSKGIMSANGKGGKLAFRIYPPWCKPVVKEAIRTQQWQLRYFFPIGSDGSADPAQVRKLFGCSPEKSHAGRVVPSSGGASASVTESSVLASPDLSVGPMHAAAMGYGSKSKVRNRDSGQDAGAKEDAARHEPRQRT